MVPGEEYLNVAMTGIAASFTDMLEAGADSGGADRIAAICNRQLEEGGWRLVRVPRN
jgi:hypothetical protein